MSIFHRGPVLFPISILQKQLEIYLLFQKAPKNGCNNFYFHLYIFDMSRKFLFYLVLLSPRDQVNPSTPSFGNINLRETMANVIVIWKSNRKWLQ